MPIFDYLTFLADTSATDILLEILLPTTMIIIIITILTKVNTTIVPLLVYG